MRPLPIVVSDGGVLAGETLQFRMTLPIGTWDLQAPYNSHQPVDVKAPGLEEVLPANLDRIGPRLPIGRLAIRRQRPFAISFHVRDRRLAPRLWDLHLHRCHSGGERGATRSDQPCLRKIRRLVQIGPIKVVAVVPTFNRATQLGECLRALASQTRTVDAVVVVDNASTEPIRDVLEQGGYPFPVGYLRIDSNTGSAGGFAAGVTAAIAAGADWVWIQDNDGIARPECLERLLEAAADVPDAAVLAPQVYDETGGVQGQHRGRYVRGHTLPASEDTYEEAVVPVDYASYIGILVHADAIAAAGGPDQRLFLWVDDLEWCLRLGEQGPLYLVPGAAITHNDGISNRSAGFLATIRTHLLPGPNAALWRYLYAFRNSSWLRMRRHSQGPLGWGVNYLLQVVRVLIVGPHRRHAARLFWWYGMAGRQEAWGQIPHSVWEECFGRGGDVRLLHPVTSPYLEGREQPSPGPTEWIDSAATSGRS